VAVAYRNKKLIADQVLPRVPVGRQLFMYSVYDLGQGFTVPDTKVGRKSLPNEVDFSETAVTASTEDFGLDDFVPQVDIENAPPNYDPRARAVEGIIGLVDLDREVRAANLVFNSASYATANQQTLVGTSQWSSPTCNPIEQIMDALDQCVMRPTHGVLGRAAWTSLRTNPQVVAAVLKNPGMYGVADSKSVADLLELDDIFIGDGWVNTAKKGQNPNLQRCWGPHASFIYRDAIPDVKGRVTFGFTAQFGHRFAGAIEEPKRGLRGGETVRAGESVLEVISAQDLGYFFQNVTA
jgi:hypothetical protein